MSWLTRVRDYLTAEPRAQRAMLDMRAAPAIWAPAQLNRPQYPTRTLTTYDDGAYRKSALIFRCVQYVANAAGAAPLRLFEDVDGQPERVKDNDLARLLASPNPGSGGARFVSFATVVMMTAGFVVIEKERGKGGQVANLWVLRPDWLRPIPRANGDVDWEYRSPNSATGRILLAEDVIVQTYADVPTGSAYGIGPLEVLLREIGIANSLTDFLKSFLDRGALPLYVMIPSDDPQIARQFTDEATRTAFEEAWQKRYQGMGQNLSPLPLVGAKDVRPLGLNFDELAYPALNDLTDARICLGFGVSPILIDAQVGLNQSTYNNKTEARRSFYEDTMTYVWGRLDDAFTRHLLPEFVTEDGFDLVFDTSDIPALQDDENERVTRAVSLFTSGMVSRHRAQRHAGEETHGDDVFLVPFNMVAVPVADDGQRASNGPALGTVRVAVLNDTQIREIAAGTYEPRVVTRDGRRYLNERALSPERRDAIQRVADTQKAAILRHAELAEPIVASYLNEQKARVVAAVTGQRSWMPTPEEMQAYFSRPSGELPHPAESASTRAISEIDWSAESALLLDALRQWLDSLGEEAFAIGAVLTGTDDVWHVSNQYLRELEDVLGKRITDISATTRADMERIILDALAEGTSMPDLAERLEGLFDETYKNRAMTISRTESAIAWGMASTLSYQASGVVSQVLVLDNPAHTDAYGASDGLTCATRHNLLVPLNQGMRHVEADHPNGSVCLAPWTEPLPEDA